MCVYYCSTYYKAVREGGGGGMGDICNERKRAKASVKYSAQRAQRRLSLPERHIQEGPLSKLKGGGVTRKPTSPFCSECGAESVPASETVAACCRRGPGMGGQDGLRANADVL